LLPFYARAAAHSCLSCYPAAFMSVPSDLQSMYRCGKSFCWIVSLWGLTRLLGRCANGIISNVTWQSPFLLACSSFYLQSRLFTHHSPLSHRGFVNPTLHGRLFGPATIGCCLMISSCSPFMKLKCHQRPSVNLYAGSSDLD
jgi:hypothetical protein